MAESSVESGHRLIGDKFGPDGEISEHKEQELYNGQGGQSVGPAETGAVEEAVFVLGDVDFFEELFDGQQPFIPRTGRVEYLGADSL